MVDIGIGTVRQLPHRAMEANRCGDLPIDKSVCHEFSYPEVPIHPVVQYFPTPSIRVHKLP